MESEKYFENAKFYVWKETFAIVKSRKSVPNSFAVVKDKNEATCVINQSKIKNNKNIIKVDNNWKIITFDTILSFGITGFLAKISNALAKEKISIFVISSYSTDHILVKNKNLKKAINELKNLGFKIK